MNESRPHLFEALGIELEYMIVDRETLSVRPIADQVLHAIAGSYESEVEQGEIAWSNELALHVIELKTNGPARSLAQLPQLFQKNVERINQLLKPHGAQLMPSAMHPWMNPHTEMRLWPHSYSPVYEAFNRIFDCRGHGWANLQSAHLNLPFADDEEFGRLHAAIRLILPILPAIAASSPLVDGKLTGMLDTRLDVYRGNSRRIPSITGHVIPERVYTEDEYNQRILQRIYADIAPHDPEGILQHEWLNARGAIARFDRGAIEIRVLDVQECPQADVAVHAAIAEILRALVSERWTDRIEQQSIPTEPLAELFKLSIRDAESTRINNPTLLRQFGYPDTTATARELWRYLLETVCFPAPSFQSDWGYVLRLIADRGPLARRIVRSIGKNETPERIRTIYDELCDCLATGRMFLGCE